MYECARQHFQKPRCSCKLLYTEPGANAVVDNPSWYLIESSWLRTLQWTRTLTSSRSAAFNSSPTHVWNRGLYGYFRKSINNHRFTTGLTSVIDKTKRRSLIPHFYLTRRRGVVECRCKRYFRVLSEQYDTGSNAVFVASLQYSMVRFSTTEQYKNPKDMCLENICFPPRLLLIFF